MNRRGDFEFDAKLDAFGAVIIPVADVKTIEQEFGVFPTAVAEQVQATAVKAKAKVHSRSDAGADGGGQERCPNPNVGTDAGLNREFGQIKDHQIDVGRTCKQTNRGGWTLQDWKTQAFQRIGLG